MLLFDGIACISIPNFLRTYLRRLTLIALFVGYKSAVQTVNLIENKTIEVNFELEEEALSLDEVVVPVNRTETNKKLASTIVSVVSPKLFEVIATSNLAESMNFRSGVRVENNCSNCGTA